MIILKVFVYASILFFVSLFLFGLLTSDTIRSPYVTSLLLPPR